MGFVHDQRATWPKLRILAVANIFSRFSPAVVPRFRFRAPDVIDVLERACANTGYPASIRVNQGSEFISREFDPWPCMKRVTLNFFQPGKPIGNAIIESFNGKFRAECLNAHGFMSLADAVRKCEPWRCDSSTYANERVDVRPRLARKFEGRSSLPHAHPITSRNISLALGH